MPPENLALIGNNCSTIREIELSIHLKYSMYRSKLRDPLTFSKNLVFKKFIEGFNKQYDDSLLSEQKELLNKYIVSFG